MEDNVCQRGSINLSIGKYSISECSKNSFKSFGTAFNDVSGELVGVNDYRAALLKKFCDSTFARTYPSSKSNVQHSFSLPIKINWAPLTEAQNCWNFSITPLQEWLQRQQLHLQLVPLISASYVQGIVLELRRIDAPTLRVVIQIQTSTLEFVDQNLLDK